MTADASPTPHSSTSEQPILTPSKLSLANISNRLQPSPEAVVLMLAVAIGSGTGLAIVLFHCLIEVVHRLMLEDVMGIIAPWGTWTLACIPIIGGLVVGVMRWRWQNFGSGIASLTSTTQGTGDVNPIRVAAKAAAAAISLGTGASLGPEGPSVEIGSNIGALLGQVLQVSQERRRLLLGAGAAAGLAAGFNAPIAGVFFALEVVLGTTFAASAVSVVLLAAVLAALIAQIGQGGLPAFDLPIYEVRSPLELPLYLGLGLFSSLVSLGYTQAIQLAQQLFQGSLPGLGWMGRVPLWLRPAIGGVCVGTMALKFPQILGIGYETVEAMLRDIHFSLPLLLSLLLIKLVVTAISIGSGLVGGLFAPAMFLGASLGAAYGEILEAILAPGSIAAPPAYAMVGMATVLAASARAPLTAILLLFELTRDYRIILPLMAAVGLSAWLIERVKPIARHAPSLKSTELSLQSDQTAEYLRQLPVSQVMHQHFLAIPCSMLVLEAGLVLTQKKCRSALVMDEANVPIGIITLQDIRRTISRMGQDPSVQALSEHSLSDQSRSDQSRSDQSRSDLSRSDLSSGLNQLLRAGDSCTKDLLYAYRDEAVSDALARMAARGLRQLPVIDRGYPQHILGLLEEDQISLVCSLAMTQQALNTYLERANLERANLERANLERVNLEQAPFEQANGAATLTQPAPNQPTA